MLQDAPAPRKTIHHIVASEYDIMGMCLVKKTILY